MEALAHRVFPTVTVDKLVSLARLGPRHPYMPANDLVRSFSSYFDFTKVTSAQVAGLGFAVP